jgi:CRISPR-associated endonuclease/helicase Cas3
VIAPPDDKKLALPYDVEILNRTFEILPDGDVFEEKYLQEKIDMVFPNIEFLDIEEHVILKSDGYFQSIN